MISTISYSQEDIIDSIVSLYMPNGIDVDPTYSKGVFYKNRKHTPKKIFDLYPQVDGCIEANANALPIECKSVNSIVFDPPFIVGHTRDKPTGIIGERFHGFRYIKDLWSWYDSCLEEFCRILRPNGVLVFKCQDTVSSGKQCLSHVHIINKATELGFVCEDLFVLLAKTRIIGHNHATQKHARKFHSYFLVFIKKAVQQLLQLDYMARTPW
jgi:hypothetical protein